MQTSEIASILNHSATILQPPRFQLLYTLLSNNQSHILCLVQR